MKNISYFRGHNLPRNSEAIMAKFWVTSTIYYSCNIYQISQQASIRQTIKSSLKLSKHSQVQPLHYSASAFQSFYNSTVKLRSTVFRNILHFNVSHLRYTNFTEFLHFNVKGVHPVSSNSVLSLLRKVFKKRNRWYSIPDSNFKH